MRFYPFVFLLAILLFTHAARAQVGCEDQTAGQLKLMTYNIRLDVASDGINAWPNRREFLANQIRYHLPDVVGTQEGRPNQIAWLYDNLTEYAYFGEGRDGNGQGEICALFYNRHRLSIAAAGNFWLSPTPSVPSKGWDAAFNRVCTWARFSDRSGGPDFYVLNTHLDHRGREARRRGVEVMLSVIDSLNRDSLPVFVMGDLNLKPETEPIRALAARFTDTYTVAPLRLGPEGTFTGFRVDTNAGRRIDYVFAGNVPERAVRSYAVLTDAIQGRYPSDHRPVVVTLNLRPRPLVIAHRGASGYGLENSLDAFRKAVEMSADMVELDVFTLKDGHVVCFHDGGLQRLTGTKGKITDYTLAELNQLTLRDHSRIPLLADALRVMDKQLRVNIELKGPGTAEPTYALIREFIRDHGWKLSDFHISSFRHDELRRMRALDPDIEIGILPHQGPLGALAVAREVGAYSINAHHGSLNPESVATLREAGLQIFAWTVNEPGDIRRLLDLGIDGFITNYPDRVQRLAQE